MSYLTLRSSYIYFTLHSITFSYSHKLHLALWGQPLCWCGPRWKWVWHPCPRTTPSNTCTFRKALVRVGSCNWAVPYWPVRGRSSLVPWTSSSLEIGALSWAMSSSPMSGPVSVSAWAPAIPARAQAGVRDSKGCTGVFSVRVLPLRFWGTRTSLSWVSLHSGWKAGKSRPIRTGTGINHAHLSEHGSPGSGYGEFREGVISGVSMDTGNWEDFPWCQTRWTHQVLAHQGGPATWI